MALYTYGIVSTTVSRRYYVLILQMPGIEGAPLSSWVSAALCTSCIPCLATIGSP